MSFTNKHVVITGGSTGIGFATAKAFIDAGANVLTTGRNPENLKQAAAKIDNPRLKTLVSDTSNLTGISELEKVVAEAENKLDVLFLHAATAVFAPIEHSTEEAFDAQFNTNVKGYFFTLRKLIPHLANGSSVLLTSSIAATGSGAYCSAYSATKAAVNAIGRTAAVKLADRNIRVKMVSPGPIHTEGLSKSIGGQAEQLASATLFKRLGKPEKVANTVLSLASDAAINITGPELLVDGGSALRR